MASEKYETFLNLVRLGIGHVGIANFKQHVDWTQMKALAGAQGLTAVVLDGLDSVEFNGSNSSKTDTLPLELKLEWIGDVLQNYEQRYKQYEEAIGSLAGFYNKHCVKMMVLKGYTCSLDWPRPGHRPCGDIDVWLFGQQQEADKALVYSSSIGELEDKLTIDSSHHHHTVFEWQGFIVENHYDFVNVHAHKSSKELEVIFKGLGQNDTYFVEVNGEKVYIPSPNLHALFLVKHMVSHFAAAEITLRQVLDWAFFVEKHTNEIDWEWLVKLLGKYHMLDFYNCINAICVGDLGFDVKMFPNVQFDPAQKDKVLADILSPEFSGKEPRELISRVVFKWRRWKANEWKHKLCYKESMWSSFWSGVWNHLLKPSSI